MPPDYPANPPAPAYPEAGCPVCTEYEKAEPLPWVDEMRRKVMRPPCQTCGQPIPIYQMVPIGFDGFTIDHYHLTSLNGTGARRVVKRKLCFDCLLADWNKNYPGQEYGANEQ